MLAVLDILPSLYVHSVCALICCSLPSQSYNVANSTVCAVQIGITLVGTSSLLGGEGSSTHDISPQKMLLGMGLIVASQVKRTVHSHTQLYTAVVSACVAGYIPAILIIFAAFAASCAGPATHVCTGSWTTQYLHFIVVTSLMFCLRRTSKTLLCTPVLYCIPNCVSCISSLQAC